MKLTRNKIIGVLFLAALLGIVFINYQKPKEQNNSDSGIVCTEDVKTCPDGSYVSRTGPKCEFAECPGTQTTSEGKGIFQGKVTVGPVCTTEIKQKYPNFSCTPTPEMYAAAKVFVYQMDKKTLVQTISPDKDGKFSISLKEGTYFIDMIHQTMGGTKGVPTTITISKDKPVTLSLDVDTGLR